MPGTAPLRRTRGPDRSARSRDIEAQEISVPSKSDGVSGDESDCAPSIHDLDSNRVGGRSRVDSDLLFGRKGKENTPDSAYRAPSTSLGAAYGGRRLGVLDHLVSRRREAGRYQAARDGDLDVAPRWGLRSECERGCSQQNKDAAHHPISGARVRAITDRVAKTPRRENGSTR